ncbi:MAG: hypothetical protein WCC35_26150, partial [Bradyrhizobium sp.]
ASGQYLDLSNSRVRVGRGSQDADRQTARGGEPCHFVLSGNRDGKKRTASGVNHREPPKLFSTLRRYQDGKLGGGFSISE